MKAVSYLILAVMFYTNLIANESVKSNNDSALMEFSINPALDSVITKYVFEINPDSINSYIEQLTAFKTRFMLVENRKDIALWMADKFKSFGYEIITIDSFQNTIAWPMYSDKKVTSWQYNVSATLPGREVTDTICVLGAHTDCMILGPGTDPYKFAPGANNNASGVAVCLEIARVFKRLDFEPKYSIEFVGFGSEEFMTMFIDGKSGSQNYIEKLQNDKKSVKLMIDNNQVSFAPDTAVWKLDFQNYPGSEVISSLAHMVCDKYTDIIPHDTSDHILYTDARYFHEAGYPAIFFEEFYFNPHTFTDKDIPENCNINYCTEVAKISCGMLIYINH